MSDVALSEKLRVWLRTEGPFGKSEPCGSCVFPEEYPMTEQLHLQPQPAGRRYLRYLLHRAHEAGVPYLPVDTLTDRSVRDWIAYLRPRVQLLDEVDARLSQSREATASPYLVTPARARAPDGYRPPFDPVPEAFDHDHILDAYTTEDEHDIVYCTLCGQEW